MGCAANEHKFYKMSETWVSTKLPLTAKDGVLIKSVAYDVYQCSECLYEYRVANGRVKYRTGGKVHGQSVES